MTWRTETLAEGVQLILGDCREVLPTLGEIDSLISDPPYGMVYQSNYRAEQHEKIANDENEELLQWACQIKGNYIYDSR